MTKRILFVDDEPHVLDALRNLLRRQRASWEMSFAQGGAAALETLTQGSFDVIVTDMRMPGLDGAALLEQVKERHPAVARIVLSGHADRDAVMRTLPVAHQVLTKPCDAGTLCAVIERTCALQTILSDPAPRKAIGLVGRLPSPEKVYWDLTRAVQQPDVGTADLARLVEEDPAMTAKILQVVNSAYFGLARTVDSIQQAVLFLGVDLLKGLVLSAHVFGMMDPRAAAGFSIAELQRHSLLTARLAKALLKDPVASEAAFTAAIVHDVGEIILAQAFPDQFGAVLTNARGASRPRHELEQEQLGVSHAEVGAYLLGIWGLPFPVVEAVASHHLPSRVTAGDRDVLAALHIADVLLTEAAAGMAAADQPRGLDLAFLHDTGWVLDLPRWRTLVALKP
jgi:putative nucleotidyltransferase with HDIG domain